MSKTYNIEIFPIYKAYKLIHNLGDPTIAVVKHMFIDSKGRRCTRFICECNCAHEDNFFNAKIIEKLFNKRVEGIQTKYRFIENKGWIQLIENK